MDLDPDVIFRDDEDDPESEAFQDRTATKEFVVYLVDASPKMFNTVVQAESKEAKSHFHIAVSCISQSLKSQIINRSYDEVAICFFNTREKKNMQDLNGVFVFNVPERDHLDRITARLIKESDCLEESFSKYIGSQYCIVPGSRENSLYNAIWVAQGLLRKGSAKTVDKRILLFTNEDDPFGVMKGVAKMDLVRTTLQRAKDAQDLGISIELLPMSKPDEEFDMSCFYRDFLCLDDAAAAQFILSAGERLEDMKDHLRKHIFKKRIVKRLTFIIASGLSIELNAYALIRPTVPGAIQWLNSVTNAPLKPERSFICADTGTLVQEPMKYFQPYKNANIKFTMDELSEVKRVSTGHLHLLGFKPLSFLKDFHNLRPSTFVFPSDEEMSGSTLVFIALHKSMQRLKRFALAFYGGPRNPRLVALIAQDELVTAGGQVEPPGMHIIYLPYSDDIRKIEELHTVENSTKSRATDNQIKLASSLMRRIDLKDFSVCQFSNPALQRHYAVLQALALDEDEMPETEDETVPDEEGMARPGVVTALEEFKYSVFGECYDEEADFQGNHVGGSQISKKRRAGADNAEENYGCYDWPKLADNGMLKDLTVVQLKCYLTKHYLPAAGKKEVLISRILTHMGK